MMVRKLIPKISSRLNFISLMHFRVVEFFKNRDKITELTFYK